VKDGKVTIFVPPHKTDMPDGAMEKASPSMRGQSVHAEANLKGVTKYAKN